MYKISLMDMHTIIAAMDDIRSESFEAAHIADSKGDETSAKMHYDIAADYESLILSLQAQIKGELS